MNNLHIIPQPQKVEPCSGIFMSTSPTLIFASAEFQATAQYLAQLLASVTGARFRVGESGLLEKPAGSIVILFATEQSFLGDEGYTLSVKADQIIIRAFRAAGAFYAAQTLCQLLPVQGGRRVKVHGTEWSVPQVEIEDHPRFSWRGFMLDSARHFQSKEFIMRFIDALAFYKINRLHWHLCDNQGWRIEIKKYPELTMGATGGQKNEFYTQEDICEIVEYGKTRHIQIYPEMEMPGHSQWALNVFKHLRCEKAEDPVNEYCLGSDQTEEFFRNVLAEVMDLFPSAVIHLGGDEADAAHWRGCSRCQACIKTNLLGDERMLQKWFMRKMAAYVHAHGRETSAWAEHQELGWPAGQIVQGWRAGESDFAITHGIKTINSNNEYVYFDYPAGADDPIKANWMPELSLEKVYSFDPVPLGMTPEQSALVLGSEACLWTEEVQENKVFQKTFPRLLAFSETVWSPKESREWGEFEQRVLSHAYWLKQRE